MGGVKYDSWEDDTEYSVIYSPFANVVVSHTQLTFPRSTGRQFPPVVVPEWNAAIPNPNGTEFCAAAKEMSLQFDSTVGLLICSSSLWPVQVN